MIFRLTDVIVISTPIGTKSSALKCAKSSLLVVYEYCTGNIKIIAEVVREGCGFYVNAY